MDLRFPLFLGDILEKLYSTFFSINRINVVLMQIQVDHYYNKRIYKAIMIVLNHKPSEYTITTFTNE